MSPRPSPSRDREAHGRRLRTTAFFLALAALFATAAYLLRADNSSRKPSRAPLTVFCAAGLKEPIEKAAADFERETGTPVRLQFGGTVSLLSQMRVAGGADVLIAADDLSIEDAVRTGVVRETLPFARQTPVIAVAKGNPKTIRDLGDLLRPGVRTAYANPESASIGRVTQSAFGDRWAAAKAAATVMKLTVTELAADVRIGAVDAAIVWDSTVRAFAGLEAVRTPALDAFSEPATAGVAAASRDPAGALRFARFLAAPGRGGAIMEQAGFETIPGDRWAVTPEILVYSGSVNRPAIERLLREFAAREGIDISTVFNGCGILCAAMQTMQDSENPKFPDVYYACDVCFVPPVAKDFPEVVLLTATDIGIAVPKGNPRNIHTIGDLARPGLRVGLCNVKQSTLGYMTDGILQSLGLAADVRKNAVSEVPTADLLVNQLRTGSLDAAIVYGVNVHQQRDHLDFLKLDHPGAEAVQPFAVRATSPNAQAGRRLLDFLRANEAAFADAGFVWKSNGQTLASDRIEIPPWLRRQPPSGELLPGNPGEAGKAR